MPAVRRWLARHLDRRSVAVLCGLSLIALLLDYVFYTGFYGSDDISYIDTARSIADTGFLPPGFGNTRIGIVLPDALVCLVFGSSIASIAWSHVVYHLALIPIAYVLARLLLDNRAGLIAAGLAATSPLFYVFAGAVLPDNSATCCLGLAMIALVATRRFADPGTRMLEWNRRRFLGYFAAGAMIGFTYWCKETAVIYTVPAAVLIVRAGPSLRSGVWIQNGATFTLGLICVVALELLVLRALTGEWINRLDYMTETEDPVRLQPDHEGITPFARFGFLARELVALMPLTTGLLLVGAFAYSAMRKRDLGVMMFFWFPLIFMTIGTTSFSDYKPPPIQNRYFATVAFVAIVMSAVAASVPLARVRDRLRPLVLGGLLAVVTIYEARAVLPVAGTMYRALDAQAFATAIEQATQLYPGYPIVVAPQFSARMGPIIAEHPGVQVDNVAGTARPPAPYVYIRKAAASDEDEGDPADPVPLVQPPRRIDRSLIVPPPGKRWKLLKQRVLGGDVGAGAAKHWAEILLIR